MIDRIPVDELPEPTRLVDLEDAFWAIVPREQWGRFVEFAAHNVDQQHRALRRVQTRADELEAATTDGAVPVDELEGGATEGNVTADEYYRR